MPTTLLTDFGLRPSGFGLRIIGPGLQSRYVPGGRSLEPGAQARHLPFHGGQQIIDVVALQQALAQRLERRPLLRRGSVLLRIPAVDQLLQAALVLLTLPVDRLSRRIEPGAQAGRIAAAVAELANLVEFLVQRKDLLEQGR